MTSEISLSSSRIPEGYDVLMQYGIPNDAHKIALPFECGLEGSLFAPSKTVEEWKDGMQDLARWMAERYDLENPTVTHLFAPGVYIREIFMPAGMFIIGQEHRTGHFNIILSGRATVCINGDTTEIKGGSTLISEAGAQKVLLIHEDMRWQTIHANPNEERDTEKFLKAIILEKVNPEQIRKERDMIQAHDFATYGGNP